MTPVRIENWNGFGRLVRIAVGLLLLVSAVLKLDDLVFGEASALLWLPSPRWVFAAIVFEALVGLWLLSGSQERWAWLASIGMFFVLAWISLILALQGESTCGCFGRISAGVSPWMMVLLDLVVLGGLTLFRPKAGNTKVKGLARQLYLTLASTVALVSLAATVLLLLGHNPYELLTGLRGEPLSISPAITQLGEGKVGEEKQLTVALSNNSTVPIRVVGGTTSCSCIATDDLPLTLMPGEQRAIRVKMKFRGTAGYFQHSFLLFNDSDNRLVKARFRGRIVE